MPAKCTGTLTCIDGHGDAEADVVITFRPKRVQGVGQGRSINASEWTATSDVDGEIEEQFPAGSVPYQAKRGDGEWIDFVTSEDDGDSFELPDTLGSTE